MSTQSVLFDAPGPKARSRILLINIIGAIVVLGLLAYLIYGLYGAGQLAPEKWNVFLKPDTWEFYLLPGLLATLKAAALSIVTATIFGLLFGLGRLSENKLINGFCSVIVEFFRAVPVLLMMIFFWLILGRADIIDPSQTPFVAVVVGLTLYNGSVVAELIRSGVHGLPKGQREAGIAIGLTRGQCLRLVEIPQALVAMLPALIGQFVVVLKDSALGAIITYSELLNMAKLVGTGNSNVMQALTVAALIFIVINFGLSKLATLASHRLSSRGVAAGGAPIPGVAEENVAADPAKK